MIRILFMLLLAANAAAARGERTGDFDYYVLALSWTPNWCSLEGDARGSEQCDPDRKLGWTLHGLWPQYESGWPSFCPTTERAPSRSMTHAMADIMGTSGLAWHQWRKHGVCSGLSAARYYELSRRAYEAVQRPLAFRQLPRDISVPASVIEEAFLKDNPEWSADMLTITCKGGAIQEARLCLSKSLEPRICGNDVIRDCRMKDALFEKLR